MSSIAWPLDALTISPYQTKYHLEGFHTVQPFCLLRSVCCGLCRTHYGQRFDKACRICILIDHPLPPQGLPRK